MLPRSSPSNFQPPLRSAAGRRVYTCSKHRQPTSKCHRRASCVRVGPTEQGSEAPEEHETDVTSPPASLPTQTPSRRKSFPLYTAHRSPPSQGSLPVSPTRQRGGKRKRVPAVGLVVHPIDQCHQPASEILKMAIRSAQDDARLASFLASSGRVVGGRDKFGRVLVRVRGEMVSSQSIFAGARVEDRLESVEDWDADFRWE
ncbi:hypothetical protein MKEN_00275100 [Mycena kentingensis (nom. inval.)]|nr:hypothetical protein MKEN_00275100 [Mycena kentingensis (nom. inval.)]